MATDLKKILNKLDPEELIKLSAEAKKEALKKKKIAKQKLIEKAGKLFIKHMQIIHDANIPVSLKNDIETIFPELKTVEPDKSDGKTKA